MNSSDWIKFSDRAPQEGQRILALYSDGTQTCIVYFSDKRIVYWQPWADPPKPDPFEEWHANYCGLSSPLAREQRHSGWDAAIAWAKAHKDEL